MKKLLFIFLALFAVVQFAEAQRVLKGTITDKDGNPIIGANVVAKGTTVGTITDINGNYSLEVPANSSVIVVSYTGYNSQELSLGVSNTMDVTLEEGVLLGETVITALGVKRNKSDVVYANQTINSDELNSTASKSVLNALQGKVAGVKIGQASGAVGASTRVVLRGETSLTQGNNALIVVDGVPVNNSSASGGGGTGKDGDRDNYVDFGNRGNDINPDDIESVTVLKGPAATTLYGSRGGSGVILVTTKSGKKSTKPTISVNSSFSVEEVLLLYKYQEQYGSGYESCNGCGGGINIFMGENFAWGSKFDGRLLPWTAAPFDDHGDLIPLSNGKIEQLIRPYSAVKNNVKNFFEIGQTVRNNFSISGGSDKFTYLLSYTNFNNEGIVLNTELKKHNLQLNAGAQFSDKWRSDFRINYSKLNQRGATEGGYPFGYSSGTPAMSFATQTPSNIPFEELRDYNSPYHDFKGFYGQYSINPYFILDNQDLRNSVDNVLSSASLSFSPTEKLSFTGRISTNFISSSVTEKGPKFAYEHAYTWADGELVDGGRSPESVFSLGSYKESSVRITDLIYDLFGTYSTPIGSDFKLNSTLGFNSIDQASRTVNGTTVGGLVIPGFYDLTNSVEQPRATRRSTQYRLYGIYSNNSLSYKNFATFEYSARQDYSSTLPDGNRGFFYQAVGLSFVPTSMANVDLGPINYFKLRGGIGSAGKDAPLYRLNTYYNLNPLLLDLGDDFQVRFPFDGQTGAQKGNSIGNPDLKPELSVTTEVGFDMGLLKDRIEVNFTYYNINSKNQIVDVNIPWSSGFAFVPVNIGRMTNKGVEIGLSVTPVHTQNITWRLYGSYSKNTNEVVEIIDNGIEGDELNIFTSIVHFTGHGSLNLVAVEGQPFGTFKGTDFVYDNQGRLVVNASGNPEKSAELSYLGSYQPDFLYTMGTELKVGNFTLNALLDGKEGGLFYSGTKLSTEFNGTALTTLLNDRQPFVVENSVNANGDANTKQTTAYSYFRGLPASAYLLDASYLKFRELSLFYDFPSFKGKNGFSSISLGVFAKNIKFWLAEENTFADPEVGGVGGASDAIGIETTTTPPSRSFGVELRVKF
ncbi:MAG: SusC/RagA family TonB-linked outer membrane protein [Saprospiraceae bacterium]|nr:SusC/RagA family TonB-linked outer membrane protein [Saprospiraceae bacterium]